MIFSTNAPRKVKIIPYRFPMTEIKPVVIEDRNFVSQEETLSVALWDFSVSHECGSRMKLSQFVTECSSAKFFF